MIGCILFSVLLSVKMGVGRRGGFLQIEEVFDVFEDWERDKISFERRYSKLREIGNGASSTVYLGQERGTDRFVAIKVGHCFFFFFLFFSFFFFDNFFLLFRKLKLTPSLKMNHYSEK